MILLSLFLYYKSINIKILGGGIHQNLKHSEGINYTL